MNGKHENRVLGRVLAVEEILTVSGAKASAPCRDIVTAPWAGDTRPDGDCTQTQVDSGTVIDSTGPILDPAS